MSTEEVASSRIKMGAVLQHRPGDGQALPLPAGELDPTLADQGVVPFGELRR